MVVLITCLWLMASFFMCLRVPGFHDDSRLHRLCTKRVAVGFDVCWGGVVGCDVWVLLVREFLDIDRGLFGYCLLYLGIDHFVWILFRGFQGIDQGLSGYRSFFGYWPGACRILIRFFLDIDQELFG